jgi:hypothetical protein
MANKTEQRDRNIDPEVMVRRKTGCGASESLKQGADDLRLYDVVDFEMRHRRLQLVGRVVGAPVSVSHDGREKEQVLCATTQAARGPRQESLAASVSYDLWRFSCEMPDAPHLRENSSPP